MRNDWNTQFPTDLNAISEEVDRRAERGLDVHTVTIIMDNGTWEVKMEATDADLDNHILLYEIGTYGGLKYIGRAMGVKP